MSSIQTAAGLSDPRVVVTTHDSKGTSIFASDSVLTPYMPFGPGTTSFVTFDTQVRVPVSNQPLPQSYTDQQTTTTTAGEAKIPRCPPSGVTFCISQFPPGQSAPMHRTLSLDYAVVISGEIYLELDSGEERRVKEGEFIVQRGANHAWHNRSETNDCRIVFVMVGAEGVRVGDGEGEEEGRVLGETVILKK